MNNTAYGSVIDNKKIARNAIMLYIRQFLMTVVRLFTVRVTLKMLGDVDYGIYNVVAGVVVLFSFLNTSLSNATLRFLSFSLGRKDEKTAGNVYKTSILLHAIIGLMFLVIAETAGLYLLKGKLNIPPERVSAAYYCFHLSVIVTLLQIIRVPFNSVVIAFERMDFFAGISIGESLLTLGAAYLLILTQWDKLLFYSLMLVVINVSLLIAYYIFCRHNFDLCKRKNRFDKITFAEMFKFSGWSILSGFATVASSQGVNIFVNIFCGVVVNAAMGVANQVRSAVWAFVSNFQTAFNPQLVKSYSNGETENFRNLVYRASKISFYLLMFITVPLFFNSDQILGIWLDNVPEQTDIFVKLILLEALICTYNNPLRISAYAQGDIKGYQIIVSIIILLSVPFSYLLLRFDKPAYTILIVRMFFDLIEIVWKVFYLEKKVGISVKLYTLRVFVPTAAVFIISFISNYFIYMQCNGFVGMLISIALSFVINCILILIIGMNESERKALMEVSKNMIKRIKK